MYKVGDRIKLVVEDFAESLPKGSVGTIVCIDPRPSFLPLSVMFDDYPYNRLKKEDWFTLADINSAHMAGAWQTGEHEVKPYED